MKIHFRMIITTFILLSIAISSSLATLDWLFQLLGHGMGMSGYGGGRPPPGYGYGYGGHNNYGGGYGPSPWSSKFPWFGGGGGNKGWNWKGKGFAAGGSGVSGHGHGGGWKSGSNYYRGDNIGNSPWVGLNGGYRTDGVWQGIGGGQLRPSLGGIFR